MKRKKEKVSRKKILNYSFRTLGMVWNYTPGYMICMVLEGILLGIFNSLGIVYTQYLFDALGRGDPFPEVAEILLFYGAFLMAFYVLHALYWQIYNPWIREKLHVALHCDLFRQAVRIDLEKYDDPEFYNDFVWSMDQAYDNATGLVEATGKIINRIVATVTLTGVLFRVDVQMAVIIFLLSGVRILLSVLSNRKELAFNEELQPLWRKEDYIKRVFMLPDYAKDLRISRVTEILFREFRNAVEERKRIWRTYGKVLAVLYFLSEALVVVGESGLLILMLYKVAVTGEVGLGALVVAINACWKMSWLFRDFSDRIMKFHKHGMFLEKMFTFLSLEPSLKDGSLEAPPFESLTLRSVSFSYPSKENSHSVLNGVDLEIRRGEKVAIVGYNGAGKTTLTKLIMRLYDPRKGEILYNGRSLSDYTVESLRRRIAAVFQDYRIFAASLGENVVGGVFEEGDMQRVSDALRKSTFSEKAEHLPKGINTPLTREFDKTGTQLSGGEQQKVAIARAFYKDADLIILDEPSAALDPDAEYALNRSVYEYADNRTVIFISHRLSTTRHADRIFMFDSGTLVEQGTHEELMSQGGKYAEMFELQAKKYRETENT